MELDLAISKIIHSIGVVDNSNKDSDHIWLSHFGREFLHEQRSREGLSGARDVRKLAKENTQKQCLSVKLKH